MGGCLSAEQHNSSLPGFLTDAPLGRFVGTQRSNAFTSEDFSLQECEFLLTHLPQRVTRAISSADQFSVMQIEEDTSSDNWFHWRLHYELTLMGKPSGVFRADGRLSGRADPPAWTCKGDILWKSSLQLPKVSPPSQGASSGYRQEAEGTHFETSRAAVKWDHHSPGSSSAYVPYSNRDEFSSQSGTPVQDQPNLRSSSQLFWTQALRLSEQIEPQAILTPSPAVLSPCVQLMGARTPQFHQPAEPCMQQWLPSFRNSVMLPVLGVEVDPHLPALPWAFHPQMQGV
ncbi:uncharacterized protein LOC121233403 [Aquila chrysaetos chrysaetos]|uniref:uncharacterized protein LOC121233403 n=1 Tax=Aquila chrysaetos chrysaetos TaxID=223781 RepID=UPI001B7D3554|nr:uncharacterized protein LOC121233403 [Aquila chrysaetos chrysaetos]